MKATLVLLALALSSAPLSADVIVQEGMLDGNKGGPDMHAIALDQFDTQGGTRVLNFVQLDLLTSTVGGGTTTGTGIAVNIGVTLSADYLLGMQTLANTEAVIDLDVANNGAPTAFSAFNTDTEEVVIDQPGDMAPWIGPGQIDLTGVTEFHIVLTPEGEIDFSAGGTVRYTLTYDYLVVGPVPALPVWGLLALTLVMAGAGARMLHQRAQAAL
ncbi:MAG: hypothetical protein ACI8QZ_001156 [Chlamydiales bacterium]|jgi:hypothetical protein